MSPRSGSIARCSPAPRPIGMDWLKRRVESLKDTMTQVPVLHMGNGGVPQCPRGILRTRIVKKGSNNPLIPHTGFEKSRDLSPERYPVRRRKSGRNYSHRFPPCGVRIASCRD